MIAENIRELLKREPFVPFRVVTSSGEAYIVRNPDLVTVMRSEVFIARPNSDDHGNALTDQSTDSEFGLTEL